MVLIKSQNTAFCLISSFTIPAPVGQRCVGVSADVSLILDIPDYLKPRTRPITKPEPRSHAAAIFRKSWYSTAIVVG